MTVLGSREGRLYARQKLIDAAREQADKCPAGAMERHAAMGMSLHREGGSSQTLLQQGFTSICHIYVVESAAVLRDIVIGLLIADAVGAWAPDSFWQRSRARPKPCDERRLPALRRPPRQ